jgi:serine/threonine protein kinase/tetratricopeptide (TPR) repeat protein
MIGQTILHYKILEKLGEGGMGVVYKAEDTKLERTVAIKFLPRHIAGNTEERERFKIEAKAAASLSHSNVGHIYAIEEVDSDMFIVMEYIDGQELKEKIQSGPLPLDKAIDIAIRIGEGLQAAHEKDIVHRDIKSSNIMMTEKGQVKIMDFGLAKVRGVAKVTKEGTTLGTITYMSPEQARGEQVDHRTDIWSLGVIIYEMVSGQLPFKGDYEQAVIYSIFNEEPKPLSGLRSGVPKELERIVTKALAKKQNERYQHVDEMLVDLRSLKRELDSGATKTVSEGAIQPSSTSPKKKLLLYGGISLAAIILLALFYFFLPKSPKIADQKTIAVLPFKNLSDNPENDYFSDGITEDIITQLSKISELKVIARSSIERYKNSDKSVSEIAKELGVLTVLEGSVRRAGNRVRIVGQLIDAKTEENLWADTYDRQMEDIFDIQSDVSKRIASALQTELSPVEKKKIESKPTENLDAYNLYLQGRFYWRKRKPEALVQAAEYFNKAIQLDPRYTLAYVGLADCYALFPYYHASNISDEEAYDRAERMARKALELNPNLAAAYTSLGNVLKEGKWDWSNAEKAFKKALELNPNDANAHQWYCEMLVVLGRMDEALEHAKKAYAIEPFSVIIANNLGRTFLYNRQYDEAIKQLKKSLELDPTLPAIHKNLLWSYYYKSMLEEAISEAELLAVGRDKEIMNLLIEGIHNPTQTSIVLKSLDVFVESHTSNDELTYSPLDVARIYSVFGDKEKELLEIEKAYATHDPGFAEVLNHPNFDNLTTDPRFIAIEKKAGIE